MCILFALSHKLSNFLLLFLQVMSVRMPALIEEQEIINAVKRTYCIVIAKVHPNYLLSFLRKMGLAGSRKLQKKKEILSG